MTCIVGFTDKENGVTWLGGDSLGSNAWTKATQKNSKVFHNSTMKNIVVGGTTSFRHLDLLEYTDNLFPEVDFYKGTVIDRQYMVKTFIPNIFNLFQSACVHMPETSRGANFLIGTNGKLFEVQGDYSVLEPDCGYAAVGSGAETALGSLYASVDIGFWGNGKLITPQEHITMALRAAAHKCCGVQAPFYIINSKNDEVVTIID